MTTSPIKVCIDSKTNSATGTVDWFLRRCNSGSDKVPEQHSEPVAATIKPLINGETAFTTLYDAIEQAESSVDIAIWGFQPSMFFKRDGKSPCIGELLITKILNNPKFQVRILVWDMPNHTQTWVEPNLGNIPDLWLFQKNSVDNVSEAQKEYDLLWYKAISGNISYFIEQNKLGEEFNIHLLERFNSSANRTNLQFKTRSVATQKNTYLDKELPFKAEKVLDLTASHHQKTVLIDYENPKKAIGFVLEHNMLDNYWDTNEHSVRIEKSPSKGKNSYLPLQDVSSLVTGQVLWDINYNFCQSWDRESNKTWHYPLTGDDYARVEYDLPSPQENLTAQRQHLSRTSFIPKEEMGTLCYAQILRTYDKPDVEDIKAMYLKNITQTTSYIYTENQYFRFPPLVNAFLQHWNNMKEKGRTPSKPIHWFVVTNSSDAGIGSGTYTTNHMFKLLGRQDVMPNVAKQVRLDEIGRLNKQAYTDIEKIPIGTKLKSAEAEEQNLMQALLNTRPYTVQEVEELKKRVQNVQKKVAELADKNSDAEQNRNLTQQLYGELDDNPGIKAHICTLAPQSADNTSQYINDAQHEVYVHSKVTIIDDVFMFIGSANLNTRSMQVDTELGIITECKSISQNLRQTLWELHTKQGIGTEINPIDLANYQDADNAFKAWGQIIKNHKGKHVIDSPLREFIRMSPIVSKSD